MCIFKINYILQLFIVYIFIVECANSFPLSVKNQSENITDEGLYNANDNVVILNVLNLKDTIYERKNAWVVEFYNSWCGHCQKFAPIWKSLARHIKTWQDIVGVAAIDCANDNNNPLCREYAIMYYPMIKYFSPYSKLGSPGVAFEHVRNEETMKYRIIKQLESDQQAGIGMEWPNLTPYRSSDSEDIWKGVPESVVYKFLLFEKPEEYLGAEVILDFHNETKILIRRVTSDNELLCVNYQIKDFPSLIAIDRHGGRTNIKLTEPVRSGVMQKINKFCRDKKLNISTLNTEAQNKLNKNENSKSNEQLSDRKMGDTAEIIDDELNQSDLETAVRFTLEHEIPLQKYIVNSKFSALRDYLSVLTQYFPLKNGNSDYFGAIRNGLDVIDSITGEDFYKLVKSNEEKMSPVYSTNRRWIRCKGSNDHLRGYPCGLWTLFHTLTANYAAALNKQTTTMTSVNPPNKILSAIHGYIQHFFGCTDCSEHFISMADKFKLFEVESADNAVLWLWRAHNQVNERLSGDITEDSRFPKIQYPSAVHCPDCRDSDDEWNVEQVLKYLKKKYTYLIIENNDPATSPHYLELSRTESAVNNNVTHLQNIGWDFTGFDISICVILYAISAVILTLVCIKFLVKRSSKRKMQIHNLFLRV